MQLGEWLVAAQRPMLSFAEAAALTSGLSREPWDTASLLPLLVHRRAPVRFAAAMALRLGDDPLDESAVDALLAAIDDRHPRVAVAAIRTLGVKRAWEARPELLECVQMTQPEIQAAALEALMAMGTDDLEAVVQRQLESGNPLLVRAGARAATVQRLDQFRQLLRDVLQAHRDVASAETRAGLPWIAALRTVVQALAALQADESIPLLSELATSHFGLRTASLRALERLGQPIADLAEEAYQRRPSAHMRALLQRSTTRALEDADRPFREPPVDGPTTNRALDSARPEPRDPHLGSGGRADQRVDQRAGSAQRQVRLERNIRRLEHNQQRLSELGGMFDERQIHQARIDYVARSHAIVELQDGVWARIDAAEGSWQPVRDLRRILQPEQTVAVRVTSLDRTRGAVEVSPRQVRPDPWATAAERWKAGRTTVGQVESVAGFGLFVALEPEVIGLVHRSALPAESDLEHDFHPGMQLRVRVVETSVPDRRIRLALVSDSG
jgi:predicted RNA-binding protein with RPS1 domain